MGMVEQLAASFTELGKDVAFLLRAVSNKIDDAEGAVKPKHLGAKPARTVLANLSGGYSIPRWEGMNSLREAMGFSKTNDTFVFNPDLSAAASIGPSVHNPASNMVVRDKDGEARVEVLSAASADSAGIFFGNVGTSSEAAVRYFVTAERMAFKAGGSEVMSLTNNGVAGPAVHGTGRVLTKNSYGVGDRSLRANNMLDDIDSPMDSGTYATDGTTTGTFPAVGESQFGVLHMDSYDATGRAHQVYFPNSGAGYEVGFHRVRSAAGVWGTWTGEYTEDMPTGKATLLQSRAKIQYGMVTPTTGGSVLWTFPLPYNTPPVVTGTVTDVNNARSVTLGVPTTTGVQVSAWRVDGTRSAAPVNLIAIGE